MSGDCRRRHFISLYMLHNSPYRCQRISMYMNLIKYETLQNNGEPDSSPLPPSSRYFYQRQQHREVENKKPKATNKKNFRFSLHLQIAQLKLFSLSSTSPTHFFTSLVWHFTTRHSRMKGFN